MTQSLLSAALSLVIVALGAALCLGRAPAPVRLLGVASACLAPFVALLCEGPPLARGVLAVAGLLIALRAVDLYRDRERYGLAFRFWFLGAYFDGRKVERMDRTIEWGLLARSAGFLALLLAACALVRAVGAPAWPGAWLVRWLAGATVAYAVVDCAEPLLRSVYAALGVRVDPMHRSPILSCSVQEFWGERWNRPVHEQLTRYCFAPFARRRRPRLGVLMAFAGSALLHFWMTFVAVGVGPALMMATFFLTQGLIVLLERRLRVARWLPSRGRAWTIGWFALTVPLFVEPGLRVLEL